MSRADTETGRSVVLALLRRLAPNARAEFRHSLVIRVNERSVRVDFREEELTDLAQDAERGAEIEKRLGAALAALDEMTG